MKATLVGDEHAGTRVHELVNTVFAPAEWEDETVRDALCRVADVGNARTIVAHAKNLPDRIRAVILRDRRLTTEQQIVEAFANAANVEAHVRVLTQNRGNIPEAFTCWSLQAYMRDGERVMSLDEAMAELNNLFASQDQHIDTAARISSPSNALQKAAEMRYGAEAAQRWAEDAQRGEGRPLVGDAGAAIDAGMQAGRAGK